MVQSVQRISVLEEDRGVWSHQIYEIDAAEQAAALPEKLIKFCARR